MQPLGIVRACGEGNVTELSGKRVLVVDDDIAFGKSLVGVLRQAGAVAFGPALTTFHADCLLGRRRVDLALLDTRLYGKSSEEFAMELRARAIPVMFMSEPETPRPTGVLSGLPLLSKPFDAAAVLAEVDVYLTQTRGNEGLRLVHQHSSPPTEHQQSPLHRLARCVAVSLERNAAL